MIFFEILLEGTSDVPVVKEILTRRFLLKEGIHFRIHPHLNLDQPKSPSLKGEPPIHLILETKGFDELAEVKSQAARRWTAAVNAEGSYGLWKYAVARKPEEVGKRIDEAVK